MGKSLARKCNTCKSVLKGNFSQHVRRCKKKMPFTGWTFFNADGLKVDEDVLPVRKNRMLDGKKGLNVSECAPKPLDLDARAWRKVKRSSVLIMFTKDVRKKAFRYFARRLN